MSTPGTTATQKSDSATEQTFEQQVNSVVSKMVQGDDGNWQVPEDINVPEAVAYAANLEKRRRDTQSALSKTRHELTVKEEYSTQLEQQIAARVEVNLTDEQREKLEHLKFSDPEAWRKEMNQLEQEATTSVRNELQDLSSTANQQAEMKRRAQVLEQFNLDHPDHQIDDNVLATEIPPRISGKLEKGEITFEEFLSESLEFLSAGKRVKTDKLDAQPNLGSAGGSDQPSANDINQQNDSTYDKEIY